MSLFKSLKPQPPDPIFGLSAAFKADRHPSKVNLSIGAYRDSEGLPYVFEAVKEAEKRLIGKQLIKEYGPIEGDSLFCEHTVNLIFEKINRPYCVLQTVGATGALRIGGEFLADQGCRLIYCSNPTWANHLAIFNRIGFEVKTYPYYNSSSFQIDFEAMLDAVKGMQRGDVILLQACCHNPTGCDLTRSQWQELSQIIKERGVIPFFDAAYQGISGDIQGDIYPVRLFKDEGHEMFIAYSYAKNMGLYGERVGVLVFVTDTCDVADTVMSHLRINVRTSYSNPALFPARLVSEILGNEVLKQTWQHELKNVSSRIQGMRNSFAAGLMEKMAGKDFLFMEKQKGMFSITGLTPEQVAKLKEEFGIYILRSGRINFAGLTPNNIEYVINSFAQVML